MFIDQSTGLEYGVVPADWEFYIVAYISLHDRKIKWQILIFPIGGVKCRL